MRAFTLIILVCLLLGGIFVPAAAEMKPILLLDPERISDRFYSNPLNLSEIGDPFILPADGNYYAFATGGTVGFFVWESRDLISFGNRQKAFRRADWASGDYWAPEVFKHEGQYVMFFSARRKADGSLRVGVAVSDWPEGPYEDPLGEPLFDYGYAAIDASLYIDADGTPYLYYSRDCSENAVNGRHESHLYVVELDKSLLETKGDPVLLTVPDQLWEKHSGDWRWNEGPSVIKQDGLYYLYYSANYFASKEYGVGYAVAESPLGPFRKPVKNQLLHFLENEKGVLISGPGHNSFFRAGRELFTAYHTHRYPLAPSGNRQLNLDRAGFHQDGTAYINGPSLGKRLRPLEDIGLVNATSTAVLTAGSGDPELLRDGDECIASMAYAWQPDVGSAWVELSWAIPVSSDCVLLYFSDRQTGKGSVFINGSDGIQFEASTKRLPGEPVVLHFALMEVNSLRLELEGMPAIGEIQVIVTP